MSDGTNIEWTDATWNPITGCSIVSPGCTHCYAMKLAGGRLQHHPTRVGLTKPSKAGPVWTGEVRFNDKMLLEPLGWTRSRKIFVCAHGDLFAEGVPDEWIDKVFAVMALCPQHQFQVLTKRPERMREYLTAHQADRRIYEEACDLTVINELQVILLAPGMADPGLKPKAPRVRLGAWPLPNVWLGVSAEDQKRADERIPVLLDTPAAIRFVSLEPLLGPIDLTSLCPGWNFVDALQGIKYHDSPEPSPTAPTGKLDWVIVGGESGNGARPMHPDWARSLRDQCKAAGVAFHFKQWGVWTPGVNVERQSGRVATAHWFDSKWSFREESLAKTDGHRDDEPDLYRVGKKAAGRLLDGVTHDGMPA
jgi:protein gp37